MSAQENIFSGYGVYERVGMGAVTCPAGSMEAFPGAGFCIPTIGAPTSACAAGTFEPWPGAGFCLPGSAPAASGSSPPVLPGPCPAGTFGIPPNCFAMPTGATIPGAATPPVTGIPIPVPLPGQAPPPVTPPPVSQASAAGSSTPEWLIPAAVGVGLVALLAVASGKKRATPNRRRRSRRH